MKNIILAAFAGIMMLGAAASCNKIENSDQLSELIVLIAEGAILSESNYTTETWTPFSAALANAERVAGSASPTASALDAAITNLRNTMGRLVSRDFLRGELKTAIDVSDKWTNDGYTEASWNAFQEALATAKRIYNNADSTPDELQKTLNELSAAFYSLAKA